MHNCHRDVPAAASCAHQLQPSKLQAGATSIMLQQLLYWVNSHAAVQYTALAHSLTIPLRQHLWQS
jgi:hypothetical protein